MRIQKIRQAACNVADALLITSNVNRFYASGMESSAGYMLITQKSAHLFLDFRYYEAALNKQKEGKLSSEIKIILTEKKRKEHLTEIFLAEQIKSFACENKRLTQFEFANLSEEFSDYKIVCDNGLVEELRAVKDQSEIELIKKAQAITDNAFEYILGFIKPDMTEREVALELEFYMRKNGSEGVAFDTICVSGEKSSLPHGVPDDKKIEKGFLTMDFGAKFGGYCSDMTRTICFGTPNYEMKRVYNTVLEAQKRAFEAVKGDIAGCEVDFAARDFINKSGFEGCFGHSTGHSLGIEIHENPNFSSASKAKIPCGAVLSVEPGIYLQSKFGVRIEDIVVVTQFGCQNLTKSTKDFIIL